MKLIPQLIIGLLASSIICTAFILVMTSKPAGAYDIQWCSDNVKVTCHQVSGLCEIVFPDGSSLTPAVTTVAD